MAETHENPAPQPAHRPGRRDRPRPFLLLQQTRIHERILRRRVQSKEALPDDKDPKLVQAYFKKVYAKMDFERVYPSDMKKMIKWYAQLQKHEVTPTLPEVEEDEEESKA